MDDFCQTGFYKPRHFPSLSDFPCVLVHPREDTWREGLNGGNVLLDVDSSGASSAVTSVSEDICWAATQTYCLDLFIYPNNK